MARSGGPARVGVWPLAILVCGLFVRGAIVSGPILHEDRAMVSDSHRYVILADNLRQYGVFRKATEDGYAHQAIQRLRDKNGTLPPLDEHGLRVEGFRTPAYPAFVAAASMFGDRRVALVLQCILGALLALLVRDLARRYGLSDGAANFAGFVWALHPGLAVYDAQYLTEGLFNGLIVVGLWTATIAQERAGLAGPLMIGLAGLTRPLGALYLPTALWIGVRKARRPLAWTLAAVVLVAAPSAVWAARNYRVGEGLRVSTVGTFNQLFYAVTYGMAEEKGVDWNEAWRGNVDAVMVKLDARVGPGDDVFDEVRRLAIEEMSAHPVAIGRVYLKALAKLMVDHSLGEIYRLWGWNYEPSGLFSALILRESGGRTAVPTGQILVALTWVLVNAGLLVGAGVGVLAAARARQWAFLGMWLLPVLLFAGATGVVALERFRAPIMLPLLLLCGRGVDATRAVGLVRRVARWPAVSPQPN
jgi:hypothetical protein